MRLTDGRRLAEITMKVWKDGGWGRDWSDGYFDDADRRAYIDARGERWYKVDDLEYCIESAEDACREAETLLRTQNIKYDVDVTYYEITADQIEDEQTV